MKESIVEKIEIHNVDQLQKDGEVLDKINEINNKLEGRLVLKLSGIPSENSVLIETEDKEEASRYLNEFRRFLRAKGYLYCPHSWEKIGEEDHGEMDYSSYGGGVEHFVVSLYRCRLCGELLKEGSVDFNGDPSDLLKITDEEIRFYEK